MAPITGRIKRLTRDLDGIDKFLFAKRRDRSPVGAAAGVAELCYI